MKHRVTLIPGAEPVKHRQRRMSPAMMKVAQEEVERMLREDIIEPSDGLTKLKKPERPVIIFITLFISHLLQFSLRNNRYLVKESKNQRIKESKNQRIKEIN